MVKKVKPGEGAQRRGEGGGEEEEEEEEEERIAEKMSQV
jgi:hypothetical protein